MATFQPRVTISHLLLARVQNKKHWERIPDLPDDRDTVVRETLPCAAESSSSSDKFAVAII